MRLKKYILLFPSFVLTLVTVKLIFTAEVAESAEKRKNIFVKTSASSAFSAVKSMQLNCYEEIKIVEEDIGD